MGVCNILLSLLCIFASPILIGLGSDPVVVSGGATYARYMIPVIWIEGINLCIQTYLMSFQFATVPPVITILSGNVFQHFISILTFSFMQLIVLSFFA
jgi:hypothetical protein